MSQERTPLTIPPEREAEMTPAVRAFVELLLARIEALEEEVAELKRRLGQTPENSSRPPSTEHPHAKTKPRRKPSGRKRGGQPGHQVFELPEIQPIVTEYQRHRLACRCCGVRTMAPLSAGVPTGQSGPRLVAFAALLAAYFRQSRRRTALFLEAFLNLPTSSGLVVKL